MIKYKVGDDSRIFLWPDNWHPRGPLLQAYGADNLVRPGLNFDAKLSLEINGSNWQWPHTWSMVLLEIQASLHSIPSPTGLVDEVQWLPSSCYLHPQVYIKLAVHGSGSGWRLQKSLGLNLFGLLNSFHGIALFLGLLSLIDSQLSFGSIRELLLLMLAALFVEMRKPETISSFLATFLPRFGLE